MFIAEYNGTQITEQLLEEYLILYFPEKVNQGGCQSVTAWCTSEWGLITRWNRQTPICRDTNRRS